MHRYARAKAHERHIDKTAPLIVNGMKAACAGGATPSYIINRRAVRKSHHRVAKWRDSAAMRERYARTERMAADCRNAAALI